MIYFAIAFAVLVVVGTILNHKADQENIRAILATLYGAGHPMYGVPLNDALGMSYGAMYVLLDRLERDGLVFGENRFEGTEARGGRPRRYFSLTEEGQRKAARLLKESLATLKKDSQ